MCCQSLCVQMYHYVRHRAQTGKPSNSTSSSYRRGDTVLQGDPGDDLDGAVSGHLHEVDSNIWPDRES